MNMEKTHLHFGCGRQEPGLVRRTDGAGGGSASRRKWTIDGYGFDDGGGTWAGYFSDDDSGQPTIASGSFTAVHGAVGRMGGGFGVDRQQCPRRDGRRPRLAKTKAWTDVSSCDRRTSSLGTAASGLASYSQNPVFKRSLQGFATSLHKPQ